MPQGKEVRSIKILFDTGPPNGGSLNAGAWTALFTYRGVEHPPYCWLLTIIKNCFFIVKNNL